MKKQILKKMSEVCNIDDIIDVVFHYDLSNALAERYGFKKTIYVKDTDNYVYAIYFRYKKEHTWDSKIMFFEEKMVYENIREAVEEAKRQSNIPERKIVELKVDRIDE